MFKDNTEKVNRIVVRSLAVCSLAMVVLIILNRSGIFEFTEKLMNVVQYLGFFVTLTPIILHIFKAPEKLVKYYSLIAISIFIGILGTFTGIGIYITYVLVPVISALYFEKKLTIFCSIFSYLCMTFGVWMNTASRWEIMYKKWTHMETFRAYMIGFSIEYIIVVFFLIQMVNRAYHYMMEQHDAMRIIRLEKEKYKLLCDESKDIIFEYDPINSHYTATRSVYADASDEAKSIDIKNFLENKTELDERIISCSKNLLSKLKELDSYSVELDLTYEKNEKKVPLWYRIDAKILLSEDAENYQIVGKLKNITNTKLNEINHTRDKLSSFLFENVSSRTNRNTMTKQLLKENESFTEEDFANMAQSHQLLAALSDELKTAVDAQEALDEVLSRIGTYIGVDRIVIFDGFKENQVYIGRQWTRDDELELNSDIAIEEADIAVIEDAYDKRGYLEYNPAHGIYVYHSDKLSRLTLDGLVEKNSIGNQIWVPTLLNGKYVGAVFFDKYDTTPYTPAEKYFMAESINLISTYMYRIKAEEESRAKTAYLARVSHEIRTPMNAIMGMTDIVSRQEVSDEVKKCFNTIKTSADNLLDIINDVFDYSKIEEGMTDIAENISYDSSKKIEGDMFDAKGVKCLLVDDNDINLEVALTLFEPLHMDITTAHNGLEAVGLSKENKYDIILMDNFMPVMTGREAAIEIRKDDENPNNETPIIALTADAVAGVYEQLLADGMNDFISKPIDYKVACRVIKKWI